MNVPFPVQLQCTVRDERENPCSEDGYFNQETSINEVNILFVIWSPDTGGGERS